MSDQDLVLDAIEDAGGFWPNISSPTSRQNPEVTIHMLLFLPDRRDVVTAIGRLRADTDCAS
jgi:hypothetical protein